MKYIIYKQKLNKQQQEYLFSKIINIPYIREKWSEKYWIYIYNEEQTAIEDMLLKAISSVVKMIEVKQDFNTIIIKKFEMGDSIDLQIDFRNRVGKSISIILGNFTGCNYRIDGKLEEVNSGDIIVQDCTEGYSMGPNYCMYPIASGIKYAITICTILKENPV